MYDNKLLLFFFYNKARIAGVLRAELTHFEPILFSFFQDMGKGGGRGRERDGDH